MINKAAVFNSTTIIRDGYAYWLGKCQGRPMPRWQDINPVEIKSLLPNVVVVHVSRQPFDFIERITGDIILQHSALNSMGKNWRDYPGRGPDSEIWKVFASVTETKEASFHVIPYVGPHKEFMKVETVICPISDDSVSVNKILGFVDYCARTKEDLALDNSASLSYRTTTL